MDVYRVISSCVVAFILQSIVAQAQPATQGTIPPEAQKRLDHLVGHWQFKTDYLNRDCEVKRSIQGTEEARYLIEKRVVELTTVVTGKTSKGWLFYDTTQKEFVLTSVDGRGDLWVLKGGLEAYVITLQPKLQAFGQEMTIRFTHTNILKDSFEAIMESSIDGGKTWWKRSKQYMTRVPQKKTTAP